MKKITQGIVKAWITSLIGVATMVISLLLVYKGTFGFLWEGISGLLIGTALLLAPRTVEKAFTNFISKFTGNISNKQVEIEPESPPQKPE